MDDFIIPDTGAVFTFGRSRFTDNKPSHFFIKNDPIVGIACGEEHTIVLCQNGRLFAFGSNEYGQLGLGHTTTVTRPSCIKTLKPFKIKNIACGKSHTIAVTENNHLYTFGNNSDGQLGLSNTIDKNLPTKITNLSIKNNENVVQIAAGSRHTIFLTDKGRLFIWGSNAEGQLGLKMDPNNERLPTPKLLPTQEKVTFVSCGYYHTAFITESGQAYTFGENKNGKLGSDLPGAVIIEPHKITVDGIFEKVFCGGNHSFLLTKNNGDVYTFGSNMDGQLGMADESIVFVPEPTKIPNKVFNESIVHVACGDKHTAFLTKSGKLYTCGDSKNGKLCQTSMHDTVRVFTPQLIMEFERLVVTRVSCGGNHTIINVHNENLEQLKQTKIEYKLEQLQKSTPLPPIPLNSVPKLVKNTENLEKLLEISQELEPSNNANHLVATAPPPPENLPITNGHSTKNIEIPIEIIAEEKKQDIEIELSPKIHSENDRVKDEEQQEFELLEQKFKEEEEIKSDPQTIASNPEPLPTSPSISDENEIDAKYYKNSTLTLKTEEHVNVDDSKLSNETSSADELEDDEKELSIDSLEVTELKQPQISFEELPESQKPENRVTKMFNSIKRKKIFSSDSKLNVLDNKKPPVGVNEVTNDTTKKSAEKSKTCSIL